MAPPVRVHEDGGCRFEISNLKFEISNVSRPQATIRASEGALMRDPRQRMKLIWMVLTIIAVTLALHPVSAFLSDVCPRFRGPTETEIWLELILPVDFGLDRIALW